jgi:hypothetical protein
VLLVQHIHSCRLLHKNLRAPENKVLKSTVVVGKTCSTHTDEKWIKNFSLKPEGRLGDGGVDGRIILNWIVPRVGGCGARDGAQWRGVVEAAMGCRARGRRGFSWSVGRLSAS